MAFRPLNTFFPSADDLLDAELPQLGEALLGHLNSYEGQVKQDGRLHRDYLLGMLENRTMGLGQRPPGYDYGGRQVEVTRRVMEGWHWLDNQGFLTPDPSCQGWHVISTEGNELLSKLARFERWEKYGLDAIKTDLINGGRQLVGGPPAVRELAWEWVRVKEGQAMLPAGKRGGVHGLPLIAESRIEELRKLSSPDFDFRKLIRICEELNTSYDNGCYLATATLTRGLLDHVPPVFGKKSFGEVANNNGGRSFKEAMQHLDNGSRKVSDGILHEQIRKSETLPTAQQVCCSQQLDVLLAEIVRLMK
jgi:hypothetical protein